MGRQTSDSPVPRYSSTVALVSTIFACLKAVTAWPEEDSSTGRMSAAFSFTISSVRSYFGQGIESVMLRLPSTVNVSSKALLFVFIGYLLMEMRAYDP